MLQFMPSISTITAITALKWEMFVSVGSKLQQTFLFFISLCAAPAEACETHHLFHARLLHLSSLVVGLSACFSVFAVRMLYLSQG